MREWMYMFGTRSNELGFECMHRVNDGGIDLCNVKRRPSAATDATRTEQCRI
jgi:hypothetical protein